jgi:hypothetical protein
VRLEGLGKLKNPPHRDSIPRPSGLENIASTNYATASPTYSVVSSFFTDFGLTQCLPTKEIALYFVLDILMLRYLKHSFLNSYLYLIICSASLSPSTTAQTSALQDNTTETV